MSGNNKNNNDDIKTNAWTIDDGAKLNILREKTPLIQGKFTLKDGTILTGVSFGAVKSVAAEVVFSTGMVGYPEALTDPSYRGQILVLTYPSIGNYGVPSDTLDIYGLKQYFESNKIHITALIVSDYSYDYSHWASVRSLSSWLSENNIPALYAVDTRALTKKLRDYGVMLGKIEFDMDKTIDFVDPNQCNLVAEVSRTQPQTFGAGGRVKIVAIDCGMKNNIIRKLVSYGIELTVVPWDYDFHTHIKDYDGLFISNGPGNPSMVVKTIEHVRIALQHDKPIFGICLGNQILALACGAKTYKMKFGNRGMNQPVIDLRTQLCYITPQNHGYAVDNNTLPVDWKQFFTNANDLSNEGIIHTYKPFFSVQFHPEAMGGPDDTDFLFKLFLQRVEKPASPIITTIQYHSNMGLPIKRVLLLGSGGLSIGQAGEFDYSGSQAIKALKEENIYVILVNPNIATIQTSYNMADKTYLLPVTPEYVEHILEKERPDGILLQFGGQTALNCGCKLQESGVLSRYNVRVLGTSVETIMATEDRRVFAERLAEINESVAPSVSCDTIEEAMTAANTLGFPVLVRAAYALGGLGSGFAEDEETLQPLLKKAFSASTQVIVDKSLRGWKEVEYEVVRDCVGNTITVCNMENFDPLGIHTGDSIVIAPSQTLSNEDYFRLRAVAIKVVKHLGVVGECNIQYALDPYSNNYTIIEVNARLSRSSALASKATGYPLAYVAAKLALGKELIHVRNSVTKTTTACFEPSLDYMVVKMPRWDMKKFTNVSTEIGSAMKSVGEVMAIGRNFEEAFQKAVRMIDSSMDGFGGVSNADKMTTKELEFELSHPSDRRIYALATALKRKYTVNRLHELTFIDKWFLSKLAHIIAIEYHLSSSLSASLSSSSMKLLSSLLNADTLRMCKRYGFSDLQIARILEMNMMDIRQYRKQLGILPIVKQIDTLAAEYPAHTNYLYMTYNGSENDVVFNDHGIMVLGCGPYRIGSSCEFDWCAVSCIRTLRKLGYKSIMVNFNPETVSTDYDECDRLYFEELSIERVLDIYELEQSNGVIVSVGGQIPNNLVIPLDRVGVHILGTSSDSIDQCEDRTRFSDLLDQLGVDQPKWRQLTTLKEAETFANAVGYPVLIRPSYVLSGAAMNVAFDANGLIEYLSMAKAINSEHPVVISKFILNAKEIEFDGVAKHGDILNFAISEHVENAGVHSGDATLLLPAQKLYIETIKKVRKISARICKALYITGPFNIQYISKNNDIKVIECNLRASRSFPFVSKTFGVNFIELATAAMCNAPVKASSINLFDIDYVCCKAPMFSFTRLQGADPVLGVEMASTGEVACFGRNKYEAFLSALIAAGMKLPKKNILLSLGPLNSKVDFGLPAASLVSMGFTLYTTPGTGKYLKQYHNIDTVELHKLSSGKHPNVMDYLTEGKLDLVINIAGSSTGARTDGYHIRRTAVDFLVPLIGNIKNALLLVESMEHVDIKTLSSKVITSWQEYIN